MNRVLLVRSVHRGVVFIGTICLVLVMGGTSHAQKSQDTKGLHFQVPEGWPIEKRGGILAPIPTEEYVMMRFKAIEEEFQKIRNEWSDQVNKIRSGLKDMEAGLLKKVEDVRSQGGPREEAGGDLTDLAKDLESLQSELGRLDRKITNKVADMKTESDETAKQSRSLEEAIKDLQTQIYKLVEKVDYINEQLGSSYGR